MYTLDIKGTKTNNLSIYINYNYIGNYDMDHELIKINMTKEEWIEFSKTNDVKNIIMDIDQYYDGENTFNENIPDFKISKSNNNSIINEYWY